MPTKFAELLPGNYLWTTRYPGIVPLAGFVWLEMLPLTAYLYFHMGCVALLYPLLQWLFLGLYELGYIANDKAGTAAEQQSRPVVDVIGKHLGFVLLSRVVLFLGGALLVARYQGVTEALSFIAISIAVVILLLVHTWLGGLRPPLSRLRIVSFAWLAFSKYMPAAVVFAPFSVVFPGLLWIFLVYGAGRIAAYTVSKSSLPSTAMSDLNSLWYVAALPAAIVYYGYIDDGAGGVAILGVFGIYHAIFLLKRGWNSRFGRG